MIGYDAAEKLLVGEMLHFYNRYYHLCVEGEEKSPCTGDSGGPLICEGNIIHAAYSFNFASYIFDLVFSNLIFVVHISFSSCRLPAPPPNAITKDPSKLFLCFS